MKNINLSARDRENQETFLKTTAINLVDVLNTQKFKY